MSCASRQRRGRGVLGPVPGGLSHPTPRGPPLPKKRGPRFVTHIGFLGIFALSWFSLLVSEEQESLVPKRERNERNRTEARRRRGFAFVFQGGKAAQRSATPAPVQPDAARCSRGLSGVGPVCRCRPWDVLGRRTEWHCLIQVPLCVVFN